MENSMNEEKKEFGKISKANKMLASNNTQTRCLWNIYTTTPQKKQQPSNVLPICKGAPRSEELCTKIGKIFLLAKRQAWAGHAGACL